ncbi:sensor histidine kinase [Couchioplanes azureus]|uniref:sensor histidine kinase n=1 Tax=Couchioplanes caeruleus TaxID=56438 RepID=UPI001671205E|nr:sensor histidine kinase [Couchioplanes caeruleus]GGQ69137.1 histidine kinase [Couchioplanes caeruleus subsp. azureus]
MTTTLVPAAHQAPLRRVLRQVGLDTQFILLGFPLGLVAVVAGFTGLTVAVGTAVIWVGVPIMAGTLMLARGLATVERARIAPVIGLRLPHPYYKQAPAGAGPARRFLTPLADGQAWLDLLHAILRWVPSTVAFCFAVTWWAGTLGGLTYPLWEWSLPRGPENSDLPELLGLGDATSTRIVFHLAIGFFFLGTLYPVLRGSALLEGLFARALLSGVNELRERVAEAVAARDTAQAQKAAAVSAEAIALRRLERDIHDGPQQRLVRLAMDLGRAEQQFATDPDAARATVAEALAQTRETLDELRALSRGIAPPILVDRGLQAALTALAGRCTVPVDLDAPPIGRLDPAVETTAYFVVAEALTNVAKHSHAAEVQVSVRREATGLTLTVADDGVGGASLAKGHGLAGLTDRVQALGGVMDVRSPAGAGTTLTVALPL